MCPQGYIYCNVSGINLKNKNLAKKHAASHKNRYVTDPALPPTRVSGG